MSKRTAQRAAQSKPKPKMYYAVEVHRTEYYSATLYVWAQSANEAKQTVRGTATETEDWTLEGADQYVFCADRVRGVRGGQGDE